MMKSGPPTEHRSGAEMRLSPDGSYRLAVAHPDGQRLDHVPPPARRVRAWYAGGQHCHREWRHRSTPYDTGTFASTGTVVAGQAVERTAIALRDNILDYASRLIDCGVGECRLQDDAIICANRKILLADLHRTGTKDGHRFEARRKAYLSPRSVGFNVHGVRVAVHRVTGEIMILQSVHGADIGG